jgi:hypothetical protein
MVTHGDTPMGFFDSNDLQVLQVLDQKGAMDAVTIAGSTRLAAYEVSDALEHLANVELVSVTELGEYVIDKDALRTALIDLKL